MNANHCRSDEREPPLQAIIGAAARTARKQEELTGQNGCGIDGW